MAKYNSMRYCNLIDEEGFDKFAHLNTLRIVVKHMPDAEQVAILEERRKGGRRRRCSMRSKPAWCCIIAQRLLCNAIWETTRR